MEQINTLKQQQHNNNKMKINIYVQWDGANENRRSTLRIGLLNKFCVFDDTFFSPAIWITSCIFMIIWFMVTSNDERYDLWGKQKKNMLIIMRKQQKRIRAAA